MRYIYFFSLLTLLVVSKTQAQVLTGEDSLSAGLVADNRKTLISGYGEARFSLDYKQRNADANLSRVVLFVGHNFNKNISLFTEMELEDALVAGKTEGITGGGSIGMEQAFLKFNLNPTNYIVAGLFLPRLGIINENHLPTTFNGTTRPYLEQLLIPATWRSLGIGFYGNNAHLPGLHYTLAISNGLNSELFQQNSGIREGRQQGSHASGYNACINASLLYYYKKFRFQYSTFYGGSSALEQRVADSLGLNKGLFANAVFLQECNAQYRHQGVELKIIACMMKVKNANNINQVFANNIASSMQGAYAELAYNFLHKQRGEKAKYLAAFGRVEYVDLNVNVPENGIRNEANQQYYYVGGITYKPTRGVSLKFDYTYRITGEQNTALVVTPFPQLTPYYTHKGFINLGMGYNF